MLRNDSFFFFIFYLFVFCSSSFSFKLKGFSFPSCFFSWMELFLINLLYILGGIVIGYHSYMWRSVGLWKTLRSTFIEEETKMVLVVRKDLKMGSGKVAAQCAHAAVANVEMLYSLGRICDESGHGTATLSGSSTRPSVWHDWFCAWRVSGYAKVVVQCADENELLEIARKSKEAAVPYYVVRDAGRTQVLAGSKTVVAVGPAPKSLVDTVTGHLKLY